MSFNNCRVRFAPSPTGYLHIGGARTALFNWLLAKKNNGKFILRIEDTDQERLVENSVEQIKSSLKWLGLKWDEGPDKEGKFGPYYQSQRLKLYKKYCLQLIESKKAYYCFCSSERLDKIRKEQKQNNEMIHYDGFCKNLSEQEVKKKIDNGESYVIRMKTPDTGIFKFNDLIRNEVSIPFENIDDQVLLKSDGFPTYHLANVVDDHLMEITHVIRGEEWLVSTVKHILLYNYFNWKPPVFAHLPLLLNPDKTKLSKRQGDVAVSDYQKKGYIPEALINYISLLGWSPGIDKEIFNISELISMFNTKKINKSGSVFDIKKLNWINSQYIKKLSVKELSNGIKPFLLNEKYIDENYSDEKLNLISQILKDYLNKFEDVLLFKDILFDEKIVVEKEAEIFVKDDDFQKVLKIFKREINDVEVFDNKSLNNFVKKISEQSEVKGKKLYEMLRIIITGKASGPDLAKLFLFLNTDMIKKRI